MTHVHIFIRRIDPALKIDLVQVGHIKDGQFEALPLDNFAHTPISDYVEHSGIADSSYIEHCRIPGLVEDLVAYPDFSVDFFDNALILIFGTNLTHDEIPSKEEGKGN